MVGMSADDLTRVDGQLPREALAGEDAEKLLDAPDISRVDVHAYRDVEHLHGVVEVLHDASEAAPAADQRPHAIVNVGRPVERHLRARDPALAELRARLAGQQIAVRDDRRAVGDLGRVAPADEGIGQGEQRSLAHERLAAEPRHVKCLDAGELIVQKPQHRLLDLGTQDRGMLCLEAIGAVEVAAEARDDREGEVRAVVTGEAVSLREEIELVRLVGEQHASEREALQQLRRAPVGRVAREAGAQGSRLLEGNAQQRAAHPVVDVGGAVALHPDVVAGLLHGVVRGGRRVRAEPSAVACVDPTRPRSGRRPAAEGEPVLSPLHHQPAARELVARKLAILER
jgi:hypothetical protein